MIRSSLLAAALVASPLAISPFALSAQGAPPAVDLRVQEIAGAPSAARIEADIRTLAGFGTRNTFSDTLSQTRGIGAARRWIKAEMDRISQACGGCMEVFYTQALQEGGRLPRPVNIVNVVGVIRGTAYPDRYVVMAGDIDSRASNGNDGEVDAPGANDNASGMAGVLEVARILTKHRFPTSVMLVGLSAEEQGLWGGQQLAKMAVEKGWDLAGVLNNDMIGNVQGIDGVIDNGTFRVFSEPYPTTVEESVLRGYRTTGGEVDGPSRQLARYVDRITSTYFSSLDAKMIYRLDRFGRGGHHRPFNDAGFPAVRIMETHENYNRQHQDIRTENGIAYGDVIEGVDFDYAARITAVNAAVLASMAWAPPSPKNVRVGGSGRPSAVLAWDPMDDPNLAGYKVYWRDTTAPQWEHSRFVGNVTEHTFQNVIIDNWLFGVAAVGKDGNESVVVFPTAQIARR
ncbi:MAG TPA: M20/M25/M40 family metallo-hydrolase [Longimicrobiales bacterium]|nr:M20/M25/M40 family metallo-hydrolase [Longimicrobiales bacterium]